MKRDKTKLKDKLKNIEVWLSNNIKVVVAFILGIVINSFLGYKNAYILPISIAIVIVILAIFKKKIKIKSVFAILIAALFGTTCFFVHTSFVYNKAVKYDGQYVQITAVVDDIIKYSDINYCYNLRVKEIEGENFKIPFTLRVTTKDAIDCDYGDKLSFASDVEKIVNDDEINIFDSKASKGIYLKAKVDEQTEISKLPHFSIKKPFLKFRDSLVDIVVAHTNSPQGSVIGGILFGKKDIIPYEIQRNFNKAGIAHVLAFSGLHVNILSILVLAILGFFKFPRRLKSIVMIAILFVFAAMAGFTISALRACIMAAIVAFGAIFKKRFRSIDTLLLAAAIILFLMPQAALGVSFQLSFGSSLGIILFYRKLLIKIQGATKHHGVIATYFWDSFALTLSAIVFTLPVLMLCFQSVSILTIPMNFIIVPFLPIIFILGLLIIVTSLIFEPLALILGNCASGLIFAINEFLSIVTKNIANIPTNYYFVPFCILGCIILIGSAVYVSRKRVKIFTLTVCCLLIFIVPYFSNFILSYDTLNLDFVGNYFQSSIIIRYKSHTIVLDCSESNYRYILDYLDKNGRNKIDALSFTSSDQSHTSGANLLMEQTKVKRILMPQKMESSDISTFASDRGIKKYIIDDKKISFDKVSISCLNYLENPCLLVKVPNCTIGFCNNFNSLIAASRENIINVAIYDGNNFSGDLYNSNIGYLINLRDKNEEKLKIDDDKYENVYRDENAHFEIVNKKIIRGDN